MARTDQDLGTGLNRPGQRARVMVWTDGDAREADLLWGFQPVEPGGRPVTLLRAERWGITNPCLVVVNDFALKIEGRVRYAASLITDEPFFCLAATWRAATRRWPASFAVMTVPACLDLEPYTDRHVAVVRPDDWYHWLMGTKSRDELLRPLARGSLRIAGPSSDRRAAAVCDLFA